jgi:pilus assembly protein FimV
MLDEGGDEAEISLITGEDEMGTKLDLAKAYIDMGDREGAREALEEVLSGGTDQQRSEAEKLLNQLG